MDLSVNQFPLLDSDQQEEDVVLSSIVRYRPGLIYTLGVSYRSTSNYDCFKDLVWVLKYNGFASCQSTHLREQKLYCLTVQSMLDLQL